jgi:hypothetical protein
MVGGADMTSVVWEMTHSEDADADVEFVWKYWSDVGNWDDPPARFELKGAFVAGAKGVTHMPGQPSIAWFIREVTSGAGATIEIPADGAAMVFEWRFAGMDKGRTRITQRVSLRGEKAEAYMAFAKTFETNLPGGMRRMAAAIADAAKKL